MQDLLKYAAALGLTAGLTAGLTLTATAEEAPATEEAATETAAATTEAPATAEEAPAAPGSEEAAAAGGTEQAVDMEIVSYLQGYQAGGQSTAQFGQMGYELDSASFVEGAKAAISGEQPKYTEEQVQAAAMAFQADMAKKRDAAIAEDKARFDAEMADTSDFTTTESGLKYKVLREGQGESPSADSTVVVDYTGRLEDGTVFDSSYMRGEPARFPVGGVVPGFGEALQLMKPGASYRVIIPGNLAYGEAGQPQAGIGPNATLVFDIELLAELPTPGSAAPGGAGEIDVEYQAPAEEADSGEAGM